MVVPVVFIILLGIAQSAAVTFFRQPDSQTAVVGTEMVIMQCFVENYGDENSFSIQWEKDGFVYSSFETKPRYSIDNSSLDKGKKNLVIRNVQISDDGMYSCQFSGQNEKLNSIAARLNVIAPPNTTLMTPVGKDGTILIEKGDRVRVTCRALFSKPASVINWRVSGLPRRVPSISTKVGSKMVSTTSSIEIDSEQTLPGSLIECVVTHPANERPEIISGTLNVVYRPEPPTIRGDVKHTYVAGQSLHLICTSVGGNPLANLTWTIGDRIVHSEYGHHGNVATSELNYEIKAIDHKKKLVCSAVNFALKSPLSVSINLNVLFSPRNVSLRQFPSDLYEKQTASITCATSQSNPFADLVWLLNGSSIPVDDHRFNVSTQTSDNSIPQTVLTIRSVKREDRFNKFTCYVSIPAINYKKKVSTFLYLQFPPSSLDIDIQIPSTNHFMGSNPKAVEGEKVFLKCSVKGGNPAPILEWYRNNQKISESNRFDILFPSSRCNIGETCSVLDISAAPEDNGAKLECRASHSTLDTPLKKSIELQVLFAPTSLTVTQRPHPVVSGQPVTLHCLTSPSHPKSKITWFRGQKELVAEHFDDFDSDHPDGIISRSSVQFTTSAKDNKANITCRASNSLHKIIDKSVTLDVRHPPYFETKTFESFNATEGEREFAIYLPVHANPRNVSYRWWKLLPVGGQQKPHFSQSLSLAKKDFQKNLIHPNGRMSWSYIEGTLIIKKVNRSDEGFYILEAENSLGKREKKLLLNVFYPPIIEKIEGPKFVNRHENSTLICQVRSHPQTTLRIDWIKKVANPSRRILYTSTSGGESVLRLNNIASSDRGLYECVASNGIGQEVRKDIQLRVKFSAQINREKTLKKVAKPHQQVRTRTLSCYASGFPRPTFKWRSENGSDVTNRFDTNRDAVDDVYYSRLTVEADGYSSDVIVYTCEVSNFLGSDSTEVLLVPSGPPDPPRHLIVDNVTSSSILLSWKPGFDGGEKQEFVLQFKLFTDDHSTAAYSLWRNITVPRSERSYELSNLKSTTSYKLRMVARNVYGTSDVTTELVAATKSRNRLVTSTSANYSMPNYLLATLCVCAFMIIVIIGGTLLFCKRKLRDRHSKNKETNSVPTTSSNLTRESLEKNVDKLNESDQGSSVSFAPAETLSRASDFSACGLSASKRMEMSPSPDSTYSSLVPDSRSRTDNSYVDRDDLIGRRSSAADAADRKDSLSFLRRVNSISGMRNPSTQPSISYMDFLRRATRSEDNDNKECGGRMENRQSQNRSEVQDNYKSHRLYHTLSATKSYQPKLPSTHSDFIKNSSLQSCGAISSRTAIHSPLQNNDVDYLHNTVNVTNAMLERSQPSTREDSNVDACNQVEKNIFISRDNGCYSVDYHNKPTENPYLAIMSQHRPSSLSIRPIDERLTDGSIPNSWTPPSNSSYQSGSQQVDMDVNLSQKGSYLGPHFTYSSATQPLLSSGRRCMTPLCEVKQNQVSNRERSDCGNNVGDERVAFFEVNQTGTLFI